MNHSIEIVYDTCTICICWLIRWEKFTYFKQGWEELLLPVLNLLKCKDYNIYKALNYFSIIMDQNWHF